MTYAPKIVKKYSVLFVILNTMLLSACSSDKDADLLAQQEKVEPADKVYNEALANFDARRYKQAASKFSAVETQHPLTDWARKALVMQVYSNFKGANYSDAVNSASRFLTQYSKTPDAPYITYLMGLSYFYQIPSITYDQNNAVEAIKVLEQLIKDYPNSEYVEDAKNKIRFAKNQLAEKEMRVGRYYQKHNNYIAALKRYRYVIENYKDTNLTEEALYRYVEVNATLGLTTEERTATYILGYNYPDSTWYKMACDLLKDTNVPMGTNKDSWLYKVFDD